MNKKDLVEAVAKSAKISKKSAQDTIDATFNAVADALAKSNKVTLVGFGSFSVRSRKAREGRNPRTGAKIQIKASKVPAFSAGKTLKDRVKKGK